MPELAVRSSVRVPLPAGTQAFEIDEAGRRHLRATLDATGRWASGDVSAPRATDSAPRPANSRAAWYRGVPVTLWTGADGRREISSASRASGTQVQLGPGEYLGRLEPGDEELRLAPPDA